MIENDERSPVTCVVEPVNRDGLTREPAVGRLFLNEATRITQYISC